MRSPLGNRIHRGFSKNYYDTAPHGREKGISIAFKTRAKSKQTPL